MGTGQIISGLEKGLVGMSTDESGDIMGKAEDAYGEYSDDAIQTLHKEEARSGGGIRTPKRRGIGGLLWAKGPKKGEHWAQGAKGKTILAQGKRGRGKLNPPPLGGEKKSEGLTGQGV